MQKGGDFGTAGITADTITAETVGTISEHKMPASTFLTSMVSTSIDVVPDMTCSQLMNVAGYQGQSPLSHTSLQTKTEDGNNTVHRSFG
jgi:hypothetical protein